MKCNICKKEARFIGSDGPGREFYAHCGLTYFRCRDPYTGGWELVAVFTGELETTIGEQYGRPA